MKFHIPIRLPSLLNTRMHWRQMLRLKSKQKQATWAYMKKALETMSVCRLPVVITMVRIGPRRLDDDNLAGACKYVRDQIAEIIGTDDGSPLYTWRCEQRIDKKYGVDVEITPR